MFYKSQFFLYYIKIKKILEVIYITFL